MIIILHVREEYQIASWVLTENVQPNRLCFYNSFQHYFHKEW